jgi:hypothetical protein
LEKIQAGGSDRCSTTNSRIALCYSNINASYENAAPAPHRKKQPRRKEERRGILAFISFSADTDIRVYGRVLASGSRIVIPGYAGHELA